MWIKDIFLTTMCFHNCMKKGFYKLQESRWSLDLQGKLINVVLMAGFVFGCSEWGSCRCTCPADLQWNVFHEFNPTLRGFLGFLAAAHLCRRHYPENLHRSTTWNFQQAAYLYHPAMSTHPPPLASTQSAWTHSRSLVFDPRVSPLVLLHSVS